MKQINAKLGLQRCCDNNTEKPFNSSVETIAY